MPNTIQKLNLDNQQLSLLGNDLSISKGNTISLPFEENFIGNWDASNNIPFLTTTPSNSKNFYLVSVAGTQSVTGNSVAFSIGDKLISNGTAWVRIPNSTVIEDGSVTLLKLATSVKDFLHKEINDMDDTSYVIEDRDGKTAFRILQDGTLKGKFDISEIQILFRNIPNEVIEVLPIITDSSFVEDVYVIMDTENKKALTISKEGIVKAKFDLSDTPILFENLSNNLQSAIPEIIELTDFSGYAYVIVDLEGKIAFGITNEGKVVTMLQLAEKSITKEMLADEVINSLPTDDFLRINEYNPNELKNLPDDGGWHSREVEIPIKTSLNGYLFEKLPKTAADKIYIYSDVGLEVRKNNPFIRGKRNRGDYAPFLTSEDLITKKGYFTSNSVSLPSFPNEGDYYLVDILSTILQPYIVDGMSLYDNDLLYYKNGVWNRLSFPFTSPINGDFLNVTSIGKWFDIDLIIGDKLLFLTTKAESGFSKPIVIKQSKNELFCISEINTSEFSALTIYNNDLYVINENGNYDGITCVVGDYIAKLKGILFRLPAEILTIPANTGAYINNPSDVAIRRSDKSTTQKVIKCFVNISSVPVRPSLNLALHSDSMFGVNVGANIATQMPNRVVAIHSDGGGTSEQVLGMIKYYISTGDQYKNSTNVFWHGQNNSSDVTQIKLASLEFAELMLAANERFILWSVLGSQNFTWNGTRFVDSLHENFFSGNGNQFEVESWTEKMFVGKHFSPYKAALAASTTSKHLHFPTMTEIEVAQMYGIYSSRFHNNIAAYNLTPELMNYIGNFSGVGLPTGGNDNDYYIRQDNGVGKILVKVAGTWVEVAQDAIHVTAYGGLKIAEQFKIFLNNNKF